ncbi:hypothetical protein DI396_03210 [Litorivita pollutaquae]|uniref:Threonine/homoserine/homoserine lactone efflux protein n=1 Tax=Litorivita pollutaquae TaxID=2200892 RepID=A0A2V4NGB4_9RHOB|nr:LysE family translocator [Litorivita pollutaquae]PYC49080.1 hypothetical protein DI396_03210 [Litorivita pollutaquae]
MTFQVLYALAGFAFVSSITPGPNNLMLMASGANFGFTRSLRHMFGISIGFTVMVALVGIGLMQAFDLWPASYQILKVFSVGYLVWLATKISRAAAPDTASQSGKPFGFFQAAAFQWVNPKAWSMALSAITLYAPERDIWTILMVAVIFGLVNLPSVSVWTMMGLQVRRLLQNPARLRAFNYTMAILLLATLYPVLYPATG